MHPAKLQDLLSFDQYACLIINTHTHKGEDGGGEVSSTREATVALAQNKTKYSAYHCFLRP
jgi:hypothetical protein